MKKIQDKNNNGQAMMIVVMVLSAVMIGAVAVGGLLTSRQTRQSADAGSFSKAIFAADAGLEWRLYKFLKDENSCKAENCSDDGVVCNEKPSFGVGDDILKTTCVQTGSDADYDYFAITSTAKYAKTSYVFNQEIRVIK
ncbi:MAG: hypothetical protein Q7S81_00690 [bacterium]|nr:hypothetical protein [bacterium]